MKRAMMGALVIVFSFNLTGCAGLFHMFLSDEDFSPPTYSLEYGNPDEVYPIEGGRVRNVSFVSGANRVDILIADDFARLDDNIHIVQWDLATRRTVVRNVATTAVEQLTGPKGALLQRSWIDDAGRLLIAYWTLAFDGYIICRYGADPSLSPHCRAQAARDDDAGHRLRFCRQAQQLLLLLETGQWIAIDGESLNLKRRLSFDRECQPLDCDESGSLVTSVCFYNDQYKSTIEQVTWDGSSGSVVERKPLPWTSLAQAENFEIEREGGVLDKSADTLHIFGRSFKGCSDRPFWSRDHDAVGCLRWTEDGQAIVVWRISL